MAFSCLKRIKFEENRRIFGGNGYNIYRFLYFCIMNVNIMLLALLLSMGASACGAKTWRTVALKRAITHPQPMTGLVLWPEEARRRDADYGQTVQLEFAYCLPCKVVKGCEADGTIVYDWSWFERVLDDVASRGHQLIARFRYEYPSSRDVDGNRLSLRGQTVRDRRKDDPSAGCQRGCGAHLSRRLVCGGQCALRDVPSWPAAW